MLLCSGEDGVLVDGDDDVDDDDDDDDDGDDDDEDDDDEDEVGLSYLQKDGLEVSNSHTFSQIGLKQNVLITSPRKCLALISTVLIAILSIQLYTMVQPMFSKKEKILSFPPSRPYDPFFLIYFLCLICLVVSHFQ